MIAQGKERGYRGNMIDPGARERFTPAQHYKTLE